jgi:hypothetical protein
MKKTLLMWSVFALVVGGCKPKQVVETKPQVAETKPQVVEAKQQVAEAGTRLKVERISQPPQGVAYEGKFIEGLRYFDNSGEHVVVLSENTRPANMPEEEEGVDAELFAYRFVAHADGTLKQAWRVYDFAKECLMDVAANFIQGTFQATDLDHDGIAEIWLSYLIGCKGDISPWGMKVIMYEGEKKFAMRGEQKVVLPEEDSIGGSYSFDSAFSEAPEEFRRFAKKLWEEYGVLKYAF